MKLEINLYLIITVIMVIIITVVVVIDKVVYERSIYTTKCTS